MRDPKPFVVGISWVVECAEKCRRVGEENFLVDLDGLNVAGNNKVSIPYCHTIGVRPDILIQIAPAFYASKTHLIEYASPYDGTPSPSWFFTNYASK